MFRPALALLLLVAGPAAAQAPAPAAAESQRARGLFELGVRRDPASTAATGPGVVSAADPRAAEAGAAMLRQGGSAADAAAAAAIALTVVEPQSSGLGGGAFVLHHDARTGRIDAIDGRETGPASATADRFLGPDRQPMPYRDAIWGGRSVGVPGFIALVAELRARHGRLPWAALFQPAIALARDGTTLTPRFARILAARRDMVAASGLSAIFLDAAGAPLAEGARIRQPLLATTLEAIAAGGPAAFYTGPIAADIARAVSSAPRGPVPFTTADLAGYRAVHRTAVCAPYRGWRVCGMPPPSSGGIAVAQILGALERFDLAKLGRDNPLAWHLIAEAERLAFADRAAWIGDPGFVAVPADGLTDPGYVARRAAAIRIDRAMARVVAGDPPGAPAPPAAAAGAEAGTSHIAAADRFGNVVSLTSTIESIFGSGQTAAGFFLNNQLTDFDLAPTRADGSASPNRLQPGKRPRSSMAPTLLYRPDGALYGALGAAGGATIIAQVAKTVIGIVDWKLSVEDAIALPVIFAPGDRVAIERGTRLEAMAATLSALGHAGVAAADLPTKTNAVVRAGTRGWRGAADNRSEGQAVAAR